MSSERSIATTCAYCGVGCGVIAQTRGDRITSIAGDPEHPANLGSLCSKGEALNETMGRHGRLLHPVVDGQQVAWDSAIKTVAARLSDIRKKHGPRAIAFYLSGQLLTEDYYVANKLAKGFIGTNNVDTNSRLCMSSAVAAYKRTLGTDSVPCSYSDIEACDLLVLTGSNAAWTHPVLYRRMVEAKKHNPRMKVVVIDPRRTASCDIADLHLATTPGSDTLLFNGLLLFLESQGKVDRDYIEKHTNGFTGAISAAIPNDLATVAKRACLPVQQLRTFYRWFAETEKTITFYSQGINQSSRGTDACAAIINCHLATGRLGKPGAGPFSITGQPNAMGGREVGGLAGVLAAHMDYSEENYGTVSEFWQSKSLPRKPGLKAVEMFEAVANGKIKAIWIMGTNPAVSMPDANKVRQALAACETVIVSDCVEYTDTMEVANILLPAAGWGEKSGTVTNSERCISRQRALLPPVGEARPDWWIICKVAQALGYSGFNYTSPRDVFVEHASLSGFRNSGKRIFDISELSKLTEYDYDQLTPIRWPVTKQAPNGTEQLLGDGIFPTTDTRARFVAVEAGLPERKPCIDYPLLLNSGRIRDQWHTMTRTARSRRLIGHADRPTVSIHPVTADKYGLENGSLAKVSSALGNADLFIDTDDTVNKDQLFAPIHWSAQFASRARVGAMLAPVTDPVSGQPEFKYTPVNIRALETPVWATIACRSALYHSGFIYWHRWPLLNGDGYFYLVAVEENHAWDELLPVAPGDEINNLAIARYSNPVKHDERIVCCSNQRLETVLFSHREREALPDMLWMQSLFDMVTVESSWALLKGNLSAAINDQVICACFQVKKTEIIEVVTAGTASPATLGEKLKCGTKCGSCLPELSQIIEAHHPEGARV